MNTISKNYSDGQIDQVLEDLIERYEKVKVGGGYSYTTSTPDKRYKSGRRETSHWVSTTYRERKSSERKAFIKQLITEVSNDEGFTILKGYAYLNFFVYMKYPFMRNKAQRVIKNRVLKNYKDLPSYREELKSFKSWYYTCEMIGWLIRLIYTLGMKKDTDGYTWYKKINSL